MNLVAQITPSVKVAKEASNIFEQPIVIDANYMFAMARPYGLGAELVTFQILFGTLGINEENIKIFNYLLDRQITLTKVELDTWGTNDDSCYDIIANKLGVQIVSFDNAEIRGY